MSSQMRKQIARFEDTRSLVVHVKPDSSLPRLCALVRMDRAPRGTVGGEANGMASGRGVFRVHEEFSSR